MDNKNIWQHISRTLAAEESEPDKKAVDDWLNSDKTNKAIYARLQEVWDFNPKATDAAPQIYERFLQRKNSYNKRSTSKKVLAVSLRVAAVVFLLVCSAWLLKQLMLGSEQNTVVMQEISVPKGCRSSVVLPDNSKVWISNNTTLSYPSQFAGDFREIKLVGKGYFEVEHKPEKPFVVNVGKHRIKVLGTKFSVTAYPDDDLLKTDLISGKVQLEIHRGQDKYQSFIVKPSHSLVYSKTSGKLTDQFIPEGFYQYWQKGVYQFKNETLESLATRINRIYNTEIVFEDEFIKHKRFSGSLTVNDNIFTFMEAIKRTSVEPIEYTYDENKLFIRLKN